MNDYKFNSELIQLPHSAPLPILSVCCSDPPEATPSAPARSEYSHSFCLGQCLAMMRSVILHLLSILSLPLSPF